VIFFAIQHVAAHNVQTRYICSHSKTAGREA